MPQICDTLTFAAAIIITTSTIVVIVFVYTVVVVIVVLVVPLVVVAVMMWNDRMACTMAKMWTQVGDGSVSIRDASVWAQACGCLIHSTHV